MRPPGGRVVETARGRVVETARGRVVETARERIIIVLAAGGKGRRPSLPIFRRWSRGLWRQHTLQSDFRRWVCSRGADLPQVGLSVTLREMFGPPKGARLSPERL